MRKHIAWRGGTVLLVAGILAACSDGKSGARYEAVEDGEVTLSAHIERNERRTEFDCRASNTGICAFAVRSAGGIERFELAVGTVLIRRDLPEGFAHCAAAMPDCVIGETTNKERSE